ncbi:MAG: zinc ABC transporter substrate-binding protein [Lachnospiraceae bacterium]|nr:zinc ABC transporter substrate-binding protein [Lachnospiraceae bacterium]
MEALYKFLEFIIPFSWISYDFMKNALIAIIIITPLFGILGTMIVNNKMAFFSDALGHSAFTGMALGILLGISRDISMIIFACIFALLLNVIKRKKTMSTDTIISVFSSLSTAIGLMFLAKNGKFANYSGILVGDILSITGKEILSLLIIFLVTMFFWYMCFNKLHAISISTSLAKSRKINIMLIDNLFAIIIALIVMTSIKWVGILIINALLILPAASARNMAKNMKEYHCFSVIISLFSGLSGLILSYYAETATGPTIVVIASVIFFLTLLLKFKDKVQQLVAIILIITVILAIITSMFDNKENDKKIVITTSFYPVYTIAENIAGENEDISIVNLTANVSGCLHDYQLTSKDMKTLEKSDVLIINGAGMESFINKAADNCKNLTIIDSSTGAEFLEGSGHHHHHEDEDEDEDEEESGVNSHIWLDTDNYIIQINNVAKELSEIYPQYAKEFEKNRAAYVEKIEKLGKYIKELNFEEDSEVIVFHDAFAYLANEAGLEVHGCIDVDDESSLSAGVIAEVIDEIKEHNIKYLIIEKQYSKTIADSIAGETDAKVVVVDSIVSGDNSRDSYVNAMKKNIEVLKELSDN